MYTIQIDIPDTIVDDHYQNIEDFQQEVYENIVIEQFKKAHISLSKGAEMLGMTYHDFIIFLGKHNISWIQATPEELEESYQNFEKLLESKGK